MVIGGAAGLLCYEAVQLKNHLHYDDALDVVGVHMVGGFIGVVLTGVFASLAVNELGVSGGWVQLGRQSVLALFGLAYPFVVTLAILWFTDRTVGIRVSPGSQAMGLDRRDHDEIGYQWPSETLQPVDVVRGEDWDG
jgi:Amt family ammonium transporter